MTAIIQTYSKFTPIEQHTNLLCVEVAPKIVNVPPPVVMDCTVKITALALFNETVYRNVEYNIPPDMMPVFLLDGYLLNDRGKENKILRFAIQPIVVKSPFIDDIYATARINLSVRVVLSNIPYIVIDDLGTDMCSLQRVEDDKYTNICPDTDVATYLKVREYVESFKVAGYKIEATIGKPS